MGLTFVALIGLLATACDPGWFLYTRNESADTVHIRVVGPNKTRVFEIPAGFDGRVVTELGQVDATIELLDASCKLLDSTSAAPNIGYVQVVVAADHTITSATATAATRNDAPGAVEVKGRCGSDRKP